MQMAALRIANGVRMGTAMALLLPVVGATLAGVVLPEPTQAQAPAAAPAATAPKLGTVKAVAGNVVTLVTDPPAKDTVTITVADGAKVQQLAVGSTDLKTAIPAQLSDIAVGDRVLAAGKAGDALGSFTASRVILMKSSDIAEMQAAQQADWKKNGLGGIVTAVDPASGTPLPSRPARRRSRSTPPPRRISSDSRATRRSMRTR
jgi:co-chaperonin GroES (HSP10)